MARFVSVVVFCLLLAHPFEAVAQSTADPADPVDPAETAAAAQSAAGAADDDAALVLAEPDFRVVNLPSTLRLPRHGSSFQLTHRFNGDLANFSFSENLSNLFGIDQGAAVGFEYRFGVMRHVQAAIYRTVIDKTFQFYGKFDPIRQGGSMPVSISGLVSIEGSNNFQEHYAPALGAVLSRTFGDRLGAYVTPVWVHNTAAIIDVDRDTGFIGLGARLRVRPTVYVVGEMAPRVGGYAPDTTAYGFGIEKRIGGHVFQLNFNNGQGTTFGQIARGGLPDALFMGFNLARKFY